MNTQKLSEALRNRARAMEGESSADVDDAELMRVLARVVEGQPLLRAFGPPGDWGYNTSIGRALAAAPISLEYTKRGSE
jgi:hypothetical protein